MSKIVQSNIVLLHQIEVENMTQAHISVLKHLIYNIVAL